MDKNFKILEKLHLLLAKELTDKITSGEAKAGDLNVARQFLKDNGIAVSYTHLTLPTRLMV